MAPYLSVIMPVLDEIYTIESAINSLIETLELNSISYELLIVESNSTDGTRELLLNKFRNHNLHFESSPKGKGHAVREGLKYVTGQIVCIYDGDNEYNPRDLPTLLSAFDDEKVNFVLGSRHDSNKPMRTMEKSIIRPKVMNFAHRVFTGLINISFKVKLKDPFTMYKLFRYEIFAGVTLTGNRFDFDWEVVCKAIRMGYIPIEIPVSYVSRDFAHGKKIRFFKDPITWVVMLIRCKFLPLR